MTNDPKIQGRLCINFEADSIEDYIDRVKTQFSEEFNIELSNSEITEIEEIL